MFTDNEKVNGVPNEELLHVIIMGIWGHDVARRLVDEGKSVDILYQDAFKKLGLKKEDLESYDNTDLHGFNERSTRPWRYVNGPFKDDIPYQEQRQGHNPRGLEMGRKMSQGLGKATRTPIDIRRKPMVPHYELQQRRPRRPAGGKNTPRARKVRSFLFRWARKDRRCLSSALPLTESWHPSIWTTTRPGKSRSGPTCSKFLQIMFFRLVLNCHSLFTLGWFHGYLFHTIIASSRKIPNKNNFAIALNIGKVWG